MTGRAVFLDRDKTLIEDPGYLDRPEGVRLLPGVVEALRRLKAVGYRLIVVTNQAAVARGRLTIEGLERIHAELRRQILVAGIELDAIYYCPYHPEGTVPPYDREHEERKPAPGMLLRAAREMGLDLSRSWMVGDRLRDVQAGRRAGCRTVLVRSDATEPASEFAGADRPDIEAKDLRAAAGAILGAVGGGAGPR
jgi:D-glycero-D-manno-heptose 1,7-bisphosphate phosphatase